MNMTDKNNVKIKCCNILWNRDTVGLGSQLSYFHCSKKIP